MRGIDLARGYYTDVVGPLLAARWPALPYAAGRLGTGSDVLGLDDAMSRDHDWGLRLTLIVDADAVGQVSTHLEENLPLEYAGHRTRFSTTWNASVTSQVEVTTVADFALSRIGVDGGSEFGVAEWLALSGQSVLEVTGGPVFADTSGALTRLRQRLDWYPDDLWRYVLASDWRRIGQELPFVGRTASRGDDAGSRVLTARIAAAAMRLGFLLERRWPPYPKWLGTLFSQLPSAGAGAAALESALAADSWREREAALGEAVTVLHDLQRERGLPTVDALVGPFWDRPFLGLGGVSEMLMESIADPRVRALPPGVGSIEQWSDNVDVLGSPSRRLAAVRALVPAEGQDARYGAVTKSMSSSTRPRNAGSRSE